jgi:hypothetical protein
MAQFSSQQVYFGLRSRQAEAVEGHSFPSNSRLTKTLAIPAPNVIPKISQVNTDTVLSRKKLEGKA